MYEQASHSLLNEILAGLTPEIGKLRLRHFYTRLGANFHAIHSLFQLLYGNRLDFKEQMVSLVETLAQRYIERLATLRKSALEGQDEAAIDAAIRTILLLHGMNLSFGGIPLLYYGDAIGTLNSLEYLADPAKAADNRWMHRSHFDWNKAKRRHGTGTVEHRIFSALKKMIALRKETTAFADFDNRQLLAVDNPNLLLFSRTDPNNSRDRVLVIGNFNVAPQVLPVDALRSHGFFLTDGMKELCTGERFEVENDAVVLHPLSCHWLVD